ncbi:XrtA/PEP-CTERM system histidine kinase PrsK [Tsuneonella sp. HG222]
MSLAANLTLAAYLLSAIAALVMAVWLASRREQTARGWQASAFAFVVMACWALARPLFGPEAAWGRATFSLAYLAWLWALYRMFAIDGRHERLGPIRPVVMALGFVGMMQVALALAAPGERSVELAQEIVRLGVAFRVMFCIGALVLVHNLYASASPSAREALRWPAAAMAAMWFYDLNLFAVTYLAGGTPPLMANLRALAPLVMAALFALGAMSRERPMAFSPSRSVAFQSFSLLVILGYFALLVAAFQGIAAAGGDSLGLVQMAFLVAASALALVLLPSKRVRGWLKVMAAKHLFKHRYDYREEWLRFTRTMGRAGAGAPPLRERVIQAVADVTDSPAGLLLQAGEDGALSLAASWQWPDAMVPAEALSEDGAAFLAETQYILAIDHWRAGQRDGLPARFVPQWIEDHGQAWAVVPLIHYERLVGAVVLARPAYARTLDWEDFDLLRVIGRQLASYLAEEASQDALGDAQRFEEFNRRIAFVMHDIKNLASQLSLLARNAERHAEKPEFRADMLVTLKNSTDKLNGLLARLGRYGSQGGEAAGLVPVQSLLRELAGRYAAQHKIVALDGEDLAVIAQPEALEQALIHLVQNAVEASPANAAVLLDARAEGEQVRIEVIDSGQGMSPEFVRTRLFKPFQSSKPGGFGIGAFEAREMIRAMGGKLDVESREGLGTRFVVHLPAARSDARPSEFPEAKVA